MSDAYPEYIEEFSIEISDFNLIGFTAHIPLPETIPKCNNRIINIQNNDDWYFGWCVLGALHPVKVHPERNLHRLYGDFMEELNMEDILIPVPVSTPVYKKFEENNPEISLCVYKWHNQNKCLNFRYVTERRKDEYKQINLLVITEDDRSHYCIIKDLHKLVYNHSKHKGRKYFCRYCLHVYSSEIRYNEYLPKCKGLNNALQRPQIPVPVSTPVYKKFEENNPEISLCVYKWHNQNKCLNFRYVTERRGDEYKQINLLVITEDDRSHYCIIKDLHKLVYNHSKHKGRKYLYRYCLHVYSSEIRYNEHLPKCKGLNNAPQRPQMPVKNRSVKAFYNHKYMQPNPYRIFWDLEMLTEKLAPKEKAKLTHTERLQMHKPCGYCYVVVRMDSSLNYKIMSHDLYRGPDVLERFVTKIEEEQVNIQEDLSAPAEMIMAPGDLKTYNEATECWICKGPFLKPAPEVVQKLKETKHNLLEIKEWETCMEKEHSKKKEAQKEYSKALSGINQKVKDHDHISGKF
ncbi:uncharacterized protein OCT59_013753 [Rhizophagus irregularis]|uniref:uncharacterized protein n=1 Tax=Rhizophagus irregularis TaxID=588596 RepID=UPI003326AB58|nr:hypothetical protein OCT59_013753 [Rhizophagus irregularis]